MLILGFKGLTYTRYARYHGISFLVLRLHSIQIIAHTHPSLRAISIKFLLEISTLYRTERSRELRTGLDTR